MFSPLPLEHRLVLACTHVAPDAGLIRGLADQGPAWGTVIRLAEAWRTMPLLHLELCRQLAPGQVPDAVALHIKQHLRSAAARDLARRELLVNVLRQLAKAQIRAILMPGTAWATLRGLERLHPLDRIELLVQKADLDRAEALLKHGASDNAHDSNPSTGLTDAQRSLIAISFTPFGRIAEPIAIPIEDLWARARPVALEGVRAWRLAHEDVLLHLAIQVTHEHGYIGQIGALRDIGEICLPQGGQIDWGRLTERSQAYGLAKPLHHTLRQARDVVGADVPASALRAMRGKFRQLPLEDKFLAVTTRKALGSDGRATGMPWGVHDLAARLLQSRGAIDSVAVLLRKMLQMGRSRLVRGPVHPSPRWGVWRGVVPGRRLPSLAIVLPIYRVIPDPECVYAIDRTFELLRHGDIYMIAPESMDASFYEKRYGAPIVRFPDHDLSSVVTYSQLLLTDRFYAVFARYEYMLITQDDVFVIRDDLPRWLRAPYDYIGAPWLGGHSMEMEFSPQAGLRDMNHWAYVGNGGFSLRRIGACRKLFAEFESELDACRRAGEAEDIWFAHFGNLSLHFRMPNVRVACEFAWETTLPTLHAMCRGRLPMAVHGYLNFNRAFFFETIFTAATGGGGRRL